MPTHRRKPTDPPEPGRSGQDEEDPIEILEVVGVDETTGAVKKGGAPAVHPPGRGAPTAESEGETQTRQLEEALREKDKYYDLLLRKQAEFDNYRKRTERERAESSLAGAREVLQRLLPVLDNMERALRTGGPSDDPLRRGIELVHQQFLDLLKKEGVQPIEALGAHFDPRLHEAVEVLDVPGFEADMILEEMQKGYTFNDRLLRPALVKVSSGRGAKAPQSRDTGEDA